MEKLYNKNGLAVKETVWLTEREVCQLLNIKPITLSGYVSTGRIPRDYYRVGIGGNKFFHKEKIMGK